MWSSIFALSTNGGLRVERECLELFAGESLKWPPEDGQQQFSGENFIRTFHQKTDSGQIDIPEG